MGLKILTIGNSCTGCGACVSICPRSALKLKPDEEGFYYPVIENSKCINCGLCDECCQILFPAKINYDTYQNNFMAKAADKNIVKNSSSGGVFSLMAERILNGNGIVYGAKYDYDNKILVHTSSENCTLSELRKSKYIESYSGSIFYDVAKKLKEGKDVLFVGTPCQIEGLKRYLDVIKISQEKIILVQFICHGVPSNKFFTEYLKYEENKHHSQIKYFDFRPKTRGWKGGDWKMVFKNGKIVEGPWNQYYYYSLFYSNEYNILRPSCFKCRRVYGDSADITIGDFWGIRSYDPMNHENEGMSLIMTRTNKGSEFIKSLEGFQYCKSIPSNAVEYVKRETQNRNPLDGNRIKFMEYVKKSGYMKTAKKFLRFRILKNRLSTLKLKFKK